MTPRNPGESYANEETGLSDLDKVRLREFLAVHTEPLTAGRAKMIRRDRLSPKERAAFNAAWQWAEELFDARRS